ncbi:hypothetical protein AAG906_021847 [Vitis piasezkii]
MVVVEAFLSSLFEVVLDKLVAAPLLDYARQLKVDTAVLQEWRNTLLHLQAVLHDAEQRQIRDEAVKRWLDDLKALAYDIEDVLDEFEAEAKRPSLVQGPQSSSSSSSGKVWKFNLSFHPSGVISKKKIGQKIKIITQELEAIVKRKSDLHFREGDGGVSSVTEQRLTTSLVDEVEVYGREGDREKIMKLLLSDEVATADRVQVIPIVGMGGVGKTTLAQIIYNDKRVGDKFDFRLWVCVSDQFDLVGITKAVLESVPEHSSNNSNTLQSLQHKPDNWSTLQAPLKAGAQGSVIIATTRNEKVASIMGTTPFVALANYQMNIAGQFALAAKTLGGLLRSEQDEKAWKEMMNNEIWDLPMEQSNILPALHLSYHYLPKSKADYEYQKEELILLWVAQGFVGDFKGEEMIEDGEKCFQNLLSREFCFRLEVGNQKNFSKRARHLSYNHEEFDVSKKFDPLHKVDKLRTFLPLGMPAHVSTCYLADKVLHDLLPTFRCLRVLSLSHYNITHLPDSFQNLKHLRYLNLSSTKIQKLPKSIGMLCNLQSLMLSNCHGITELPSEIKNLIHLHHLDISGTKLEGIVTRSVPPGSALHFNLQNVVNATDALKANLKKRKTLMTWCLRGIQICLSLPPLGQLQSLKDLQIARMDGVQNVGADFYGNNDCDSSSMKPLGSLEILRFEEMLEWEEWVCRGVEFPCLKELYIKKCPKLKKDLPKHLPKLTKLQISKCGQLVCRLPMAPSIRELMLEECDDVVVRSASSLTSLASLDISNVCKIPDELGQLHSLVQLSVRCCPELKEIPPILHSLTSLKNLNIQQCESLASFPEMALPPMLERLEIIDCPTLESLPEGMMQNNTTLQHLSIEYCDSLRSLPRDIDSLKTLSIYGCKKLELALQEDMTHNHYASLTKFVISNCDSLTSFPLASFTKLETLHLWNCTNLESLYIPDGLHHMDLTSLQILNFYHCPNLISFPQGGLPTPNLTSLWISWCKKLKSLPQGMHSLLTSLERLRIEGCPEIDSFPIGGLPTNLSDLDIRNCNKLMACRMEWHLQTLPFLSWLGIGGPEEERLESFPEERFLPSTLTSLIIDNFPNLKSLDNKGLEHLTSLETLSIYHCEKLKSLPKQGLPSSLSHLYILKCPLLEKRCQRDKGKKWPNISHIPCIVMFNEKGFSYEEVILS